MDKATTNDALMDHIPADLETEGKYSIWYAQQHRLRCNGHIINLAVSAFLFWKNPEAEAQAEGNHEPRIGLSTAELNTWRKMGRLGKLYNIIIYITESTPRAQAFLRSKWRVHAGTGQQNAEEFMVSNAWLVAYKSSGISPSILFFLLSLINYIECYTSILQRGTRTQIRQTGYSWPENPYLHSWFFTKLLWCEGRQSTIDAVLSTMEFCLRYLKKG